MNAARLALVTAVAFSVISTSAPPLRAQLDLSPKASATLPDGFAPESIAAASDGTLYVGSTTEGSIRRIRPGSEHSEPFVAASAGGLLSVEGVAIDERAGLLWACSADLGLRAVAPKPPSGLKAFDLETGLARISLDLPGGGFCNDVALDGTGRPYVTDSLNPRVLRASADGNRLEEWLRDDALGGPSYQLNGIAFAPDGSLFLTKSAAGELLRITRGPGGTPGKIDLIALSERVAWPDAVRVLSVGRLILFDSVVGGNGRILMVTLSADGLRGNISTVLDGLDSPSSGVVVGGAVRFIESRFAHWFIGARKAEPLGPFRVRTLRLPNSGDAP